MEGAVEREERSKEGGIRQEGSGGGQGDIGAHKGPLGEAADEEA